MIKKVMTVSVKSATSDPAKVGDPLIEDFVRVRIPHRLAEQGDIVSNTVLLELFGDVASLLLFRLDGDQSVLASYDSAVFHQPTYGGDYIHAVGRVVRVGKRSRTMEFEAFKLVQTAATGMRVSAGRYFTDPPLVATARFTCVIPKEAVGDAADSAPKTPGGPR